MASETTTASGGGIGCGTVLFLIFLVLKLTGTIAWSWWWVFAPIWIPVALVAAFLLAFGIVAVFSKD
jgi:hypothetical protein